MLLALLAAQRHRDMRGTGSAVDRLTTETVHRPWSRHATFHFILFYFPHIFGCAGAAGGVTRAAASNVEPEQMLAAALQAAQQFEVLHP